MTIARTGATGSSLHPDVLAFSSSLALDRALLREDLAGSLAHLCRLAKRRLDPPVDGRAWHKPPARPLGEAAKGPPVLPREEGGHMGAEARLARRAREPPGRI